MAAIALSLLACTAVPGASQIGEPSVTPVPSGDPSNSADCFQTTLHSDGFPTSINRLRELVTVVYVATFVAFGDPHWNTPDGKRPTREEFQSTSASMYRPVVIDIEEQLLPVPLAGQALDALDVGPSSLSLRGGSLGCDSITFEDGIELKQGVPYVVLFMPILNSLDEPSGRLNLQAAWPIDEDGLVTTRVDGVLTVDQISVGLLKGIESPPPGNEPTTGPPG